MANNYCTTLALPCFGNGIELQERMNGDDSSDGDRWDS